MPAPASSGTGHQSSPVCGSFPEGRGGRTPRFLLTMVISRPGPRQDVM